MITWIKALLAARRLHIRDKGFTNMTKTMPDGATILYRYNEHPRCGFRTRIGINQAGQPVIWCHVCELILNPKLDDGNGGMDDRRPPTVVPPDYNPHGGEHLTHESRRLMTEALKKVKAP